jgi:hypothetical protein
MPCLSHAYGLFCQRHRSGDEELWTLVCQQGSYTRAPSGTTMRCCTAFVPKLPRIRQPVLRASACVGRLFGSQIAVGVIFVRVLIPEEQLCREQGWGCNLCVAQDSLVCRVAGF